MLENLFKTWVELAPEEVKFGMDSTELYFKRNTEEYGKIGIETSEPLLIYEQDALQCYVQRCIQKRPEWAWMIFSSDTSKSFSATVWVGENADEFLIENKSCAAEGLLFAYLKALAQQRSVITGQWKHFKPTTPICNVIAIASRQIETPQEGVQYYPWPYLLEEDPNESIQLIEIKKKHYYLANKDYGDRVFYHYDNDKQWAREKSNFLGLVGPEHPESEGLLRFREIFN